MKSSQRTTMTSKRVFKVWTIRFGFFVLLVPAFVLLLFSRKSSSQTAQSGLRVAGEALSVGMNRHEALRRLSSCCNITPLGANAVIVQNKTNTAQELGGMVYF